MTLGIHTRSQCHLILITGASRGLASVTALRNDRARVTGQVSLSPGVMVTNPLYLRAFRSCGLLCSYF